MWLAFNAIGAISFVVMAYQTVTLFWHKDRMLGCCVAICLLCDAMGCVWKAFV